MTVVPYTIMPWVSRVSWPITGQAPRHNTASGEEIPQDVDDSSDEADESAYEDNDYLDAFFFFFF